MEYVSLPSCSLIHRARSNKCVKCIFKGSRILDGPSQLTRLNFVDHSLECRQVFVRTAGKLSQVPGRCAKVVIKLLELMFCWAVAEELATTENMSTLNPRRLDQHTLEELLKSTTDSCRIYGEQPCWVDQGVWNEETLHWWQRRVTRTERWGQVLEGPGSSRWEPNDGIVLVCCLWGVGGNGIADVVSPFNSELLDISPLEGYEDMSEGLEAERHSDMLQGKLSRKAELRSFSSHTSSLIHKAVTLNPTINKVYLLSDYSSALQVIFNPSPHLLMIEKHHTPYLSISLPLMITWYNKKKKNIIDNNCEQLRYGH